MSMREKIVKKWLYKYRFSIRILWMKLIRNRNCIQVVQMQVVWQQTYCQNNTFSFSNFQYIQFI